MIRVKGAHVDVVRKTGRASSMRRGTEAGQVVVATVSGDVPGSPVDLSFTVRFDGRDRIAALTIRP